MELTRSLTGPYLRNVRTTEIPGQNSVRCGSRNLVPRVFGIHQDAGSSSASRSRKTCLRSCASTSMGSRGCSRSQMFSKSLLQRGGAVVFSFHSEDSYADDLSLPPALDEILDFLSEEEKQKQEQNGSIGDYYSSDSTQRRDADDGVEEGYVGLFVRLLGLDNSGEDREEAVQALWRHSAGGKDFIDQIVEFPGCLNLIVNLLPSDRPASSEAAAGLLRNISAVSTYRSAVVEAGALEEIAGLLTRRSICSEVKEQATRVLWNLTLDDGPRRKLIQREILHVLLSMLGSSVVGEREAAAGVISNLALSSLSHATLLNAGVIPKLGNIILSDKEESKVARQEARNALLELATARDVKEQIVEVGLVLVPSIGASAYRSFKPLLQVPSVLPEGVKIQKSTQSPESKFGAGELLLGLNVENADIDDATRLTIEGKVRQQFLARIGLLGKSQPVKSDHRGSGNEKFTLLPWWDGIPRLVLILGLDDLAVATQAALALADIAINQEIRQAILKGGAIPHLVRLLGSGDEEATEAAASALGKLAVSPEIRQSINAHDAPSALIAILKAENAPEYVRERVVEALYRLSQTGEDLETILSSPSTAMTQSGERMPGLEDIVRSEDASVEVREEAEEILEEMSNLMADPRDKIVVAGGIRPLIEILMSTSPGQAEKAAGILENVCTTSSNAAAIVGAGVESAITFLFRADFQEGEVNFPNGTTVSKEEGHALLCAASRLLEKLAGYEKVQASVFAPLLGNILQSDISIQVKDWVSACLLKLDFENDGLDYEREVITDFDATVHDTIPWLYKEMGEGFSPTVRERAVMHLRHLLSQGRSAYAVALAEVGGIPRLVSLLKVGRLEGRGAAVAILYCLSTNVDYRSEIRAAGAVPLLVELIKMRIPEWKVAVYLLRALSSS